MLRLIYLNRISSVKSFLMSSKQQVPCASKASQKNDDHASKNRSDHLKQASGLASTEKNAVRNISSAVEKNHSKSRGDKRSARMIYGQKLSSSSVKVISTMEDVADCIKSGNAKSIVVMVGAGISTSSGIPDFRSPGTGIYDNLQEYNIPYPEAVFDIEYFRIHPRPFFTLAKELYPTGKYRPNFIHYFLRLLHEKNLLHRLYSQNIDGLERLAGIPADKLVEAHGTFLTSTCTRCRKPVSADLVKAAIFQDKIPRCYDEKCRGIVKPDIVFFGEDLPASFYAFENDFSKADLLLVMGTSLEVRPFAGIVDAVSDDTPRVLFNRERVGPFVRKKLKANDVAVTGDMVENLQTFSKLLGWSDALEKLIKESEDKVKSESETIQQPQTDDLAKLEEQDNTEFIVDRLKGTHITDGQNTTIKSSDKEDNIR